MIRRYFRTLPAGLWACRWYVAGCLIGYGYAWWERTR
jgi:hypothetical protein